MPLLKQSAGFSLIELLVVVAIIGILATLTGVSMNNARRASRDPRRLSDIKQLQLALRLYYLDNGSYPSSVMPSGSIASRGTSYLLRVPENPAPQSDGNCPSLGYRYHSLEAGQTFALNFCLGGRADTLAAGEYSATANGILSCPSGYTRVVGSPRLGTTDFCAMTYEAKCRSGNSEAAPTKEGAYDNAASPCALSDIVSQANGLPIANVSQDEARAYCAAAGAHLMTNAEWMTIARDAELIPENWEAGTVGSGFMPRGNFGEDFSVQDASDPYGGGELADDFTWYRRLSLSTDDVIWDMSGNVSEWVDDTCLRGSGQGKYSAAGAGGTPLFWNDPELTDYEQAAAGPYLPLWLTGDYYGSYRGCAANGYAMIRGGAVNDGDREESERSPGLYFLDMDHAASEALSVTGFRCVK